MTEAEFPLRDARRKGIVPKCMLLASEAKALDNENLGDIRERGRLRIILELQRELLELRSKDERNEILEREKKKF